MTIDMDRVAYHVDLTKRLASYYVIADDEGIYLRRGEPVTRVVLDVQRVSDDPIEHHVQYTDLENFVATHQSPLIFRIVQAYSYGHATHLVLDEYAHEQKSNELWESIVIDDDLD